TGARTPCAASRATAPRCCCVRSRRSRGSARCGPLAVASGPTPRSAAGRRSSARPSASTVGTTAPTSRSPRRQHRGSATTARHHPPIRGSRPASASRSRSIIRGVGTCGATRICRDAADPSVTIARVDLLADLDARGLIHDSTDRDALAKRLADGPIGVYVGFDPSGDSLHAGNLIGQITLRRFQLAGHKPIVLAGGATGMIGDPSGVSEERNLLDPETLAKNLEGITVQLEKLLDFTPGPQQARLVNNYTWTSQFGLLDFLR